MFYLLFIWSCLIVRLEIHFGESLRFIGISQFISSVHDLTHFCLMWVFTEFNLWTHIWAVFVLCVLFYKPAFDIISHSHTFFFLLIFRVIKRVSIYLFSMPVSLSQWRGKIGAFYNTLTFSKISIFYLLTFTIIWVRIL